MKITKSLNYYKKEILVCITIFILIALFSFSIAVFARGCSESLRNGTARQGIVDIGKGIKSIIEDINKNEN